ncbi:fimbrial protein [Salmonella enterica]|nr:fimbrial protein [Salmonella enterica]
MIRKTLIAAATVAAVMSSASVFAAGTSGDTPVSTSTGKFGGGTITFTGSVTEAPCSIPAGEANQTIDLGVVSNKVLTSSGSPGSTPVPVKINLKNCDLGSSTYTKASLKFLDDGNLSSAGKNKGLLNVTGSKDVAVQLLDRTGIHPIDFTSDASMKPGTEVSLSTGTDSTIVFMAHMTGVTGSSGTPPAGDIKAQVSYQLDYH